MIDQLHQQGVEPFYRLGTTIENSHRIKTYHIYPPKDYQKWAKICEGIIRHYNEGWADGFFTISDIGKSGMSRIMSLKLKQMRCGKEQKKSTINYMKQRPVI